jgi:hypothetical protein
MARRKKAERQADLVLIAEMYVKNETVRTIAERLNKIRDYKISFQTVHNDIQSILEEWRNRKEDMVTSHVAIELEKSLVRERKIWEAWEKSESNLKSKRTKKKGNKSGTESMEIQEDEEEGIGYYKFMELMQKEADFRCKLLGSFAAIDVNNNVKTDGAVIILPSNGRDVDNEGN